MSDAYQKVAERIIRDAIENIEYMTIVENADDGMDEDELEKRVRGAIISITFPEEEQ